MTILEPSSSANDISGEAAVVPPVRSVDPSPSVESSMPSTEQTEAIAGDEGEIEVSAPTRGAGWAEIAADDDNELVRRWKQSPFAVGLTQPTWADEGVGCCHLVQNFTLVALSACVCSKLGAGRVGNMVVLAQRVEAHRDQVTGTTTSRPRLLWVVGPYWMVLLCLTVPLFSLLSLWTAYTRIIDNSLPVVFIWTVCTAGLFLSLGMVSCSDPGILYRHDEPPGGEDGTWRWNDQALTYRPVDAKYDTECAVVVEKFDHTCPWTGTAIGKNNMMWFRLFVAFVSIDIVINVVVLVLL